MANTFKVATFAAEPANTTNGYTVYTAPSSPSTTTIVLGLVLANIHTSQITATVELVSDTTGGGRAADNGTSVIIKDAPIPVGSSLELLAGNKVVLETTDAIKVTCSVADKLSGTLSIMEIT